MIYYHVSYYINYFHGSYSLHGVLFVLKHSSGRKSREGKSIVVKLFVLGNPGCGKSTTARHIQSLVKSYQWTYLHINDYTILRKMFLEDSQRDEKETRFKSAPYGGFTVLYFEDFDEALRQLEIKVKADVNFHRQLLSRPIFALIEFARNDYEQAFRQFNSDFLQEAYFLYLDTDILICKDRISERIKKPANEKTEDDYFVSNDIFESYYSHEERLSLAEILEKYNIKRENVLIIKNNEGLEVISPRIESFMKAIIEARVD